MNTKPPRTPELMEAFEKASSESKKLLDTVLDSMSLEEKNFHLHGILVASDQHLPNVALLLGASEGAVAKGILVGL